MRVYNSWCYYTSFINSSNLASCGARLCLRRLSLLANRRPRRFLTLAASHTVSARDVTCCFYIYILAFCRGGRPRPPANSVKSNGTPKASSPTSQISNRDTIICKIRRFILIYYFSNGFSVNPVAKLFIHSTFF